MDLSLDLNLVVARIATAQLDAKPAFKKVGGALNYAAALRDLKNKIPAAYVVPTRESPGRNQIAAGGFRQVVVESIGVLTIVSTVNSDTGDKAHGDLRLLRHATRDVLLDWTPDSEVYDPFEAAGGRLLEFRTDALVWIDEYRTSYQMEKTG